MNDNRSIWKQASLAFMGTILLGGLISSAYWLGHADTVRQPAPKSPPDNLVNAAKATKDIATPAPTLLPINGAVCKKPNSLSPIQWVQCDNLRIVSLKQPLPPVEMNLVNVYMAKRIQLANNFEQGQMNLADFNVRLSEVQQELVSGFQQSYNEARERSLRALSTLPAPIAPSVHRSMHCTTIDTGISRDTNCF